MARVIIVLGPLVDAAISGASWLFGDERLGLFTCTTLSLGSLMLMSVVHIAADALELPDVMPSE